MDKGIFIAIIIVFAIILFNMNKANQEEMISLQVKYENEIEDLEAENKDLKERLDNINSLATTRHYYWVELLDDIESESAY